MTREEYDQLDSDGRVACPDCGEKTTQPYPGCHCPSRWNKNALYPHTHHINSYHHSCAAGYKKKLRDKAYAKMGQEVYA